jgi:hypothetical protein
MSNVLSSFSFSYHLFYDRTRKRTYVYRFTSSIIHFFSIDYFKSIAIVCICQPREHAVSCRFFADTFDKQRIYPMACVFILDSSNMLFILFTDRIALELKCNHMYLNDFFLFKFLIEKKIVVGR